MGALNPDVDLRHRRRALTQAEFDRLVEATAGNKPFRRLSGVDRLVLYVFAANTGFRAEELGSLTPRSFRLDDVPPTATVRAADAKNRRKAVQVLRADVAEMMRGRLKGKADDAPVWPGTWTKSAAAMVRADLEAAGIPYADAEGRVFDFHAGSRVQFISFLAAAGANVKVAQTLARHSDIRLTMDVYVKRDVLNVTEGLNLMPPLPRPARPTRKSGAPGARRRGFQLHTSCTNRSPSRSAAVPACPRAVRDGRDVNSEYETVLSTSVRACTHPSGQGVSEISCILVLFVQVRILAG